MEKELNHLFTYFQNPFPIRGSIHSNNIIERMNKEIGENKDNRSPSSLGISHENNISQSDGAE